MCTFPAGTAVTPGGVGPMWKLTLPLLYTVKVHATVFHVVVDNPVTVVCCTPVHDVVSFTLRITLLVVPALNSQWKYMVAPTVRDVYGLYTFSTD